MPLLLRELPRGDRGSRHLLDAEHRATLPGDSRPKMWFQVSLASPAGKLARERATAFLDRFCPSLGYGRRRTP